ncbi:Right handed beta helix region [Cohaesibacter marisflavi]|uniref:Right handed beta helix region n=1 Tax=Cohaesibacter marisflavi TaxID=655353 RepID=A0A1I5AFI3_9HYPH|nr:TIR domain-containing protein [Cohaesibacter marisflavi]SFN60969.1 Right handed beta helix region [Cohaesibacter marisflavi]
MTDPICFISYASEDLLQAQALYRRLREAGLSPWMDKPPSPYKLEGLKPGELWEDRLRDVIRTSKYFLPLFSEISVQKVGYVQSEFRQALARLALVPAGKTFVLPVRIEECQIPKTRVDGISFAQYQYIDCFQANFSELVTHISSLEGREVGAIDHRKVDVYSADEFLSCIGSNTSIYVRRSFSLSGIEVPDNHHVFAREVFDGEELVFRGVNNLTIKGSSDARITVEPTYATTMSFEDCHGVTIEGTALGHWPKGGECKGAVLNFKHCSSICVDNCKIFGCGTYGFEIENSQFVRFQNCDIYKCSYGVFRAIETSSLKLVEVEFYDNFCFDAFIIKKSDVSFERCEVRNNRPRDDRSSMFSIYRSNISFSETSLEIGDFGSVGLPDDQQGVVFLQRTSND